MTTKDVKAGLVAKTLGPDNIDTYQQNIDTCIYIYIYIYIFIPAGLASESKYLDLPAS